MKRLGTMFGQEGALHLRLAAATGLWCGFACAGASAPEPFVETDSAGIVVVTSRAPTEAWRLADRPQLAIGPADGGPAEFYRIRNVLALPDGRLAIANGGSEEIRYFASDGRYLGVTGSKGRGPDEYLGLGWLAATGDSLLTHDWGNDRITVRDQGGVYGRTFRLEWHYGMVSPIAVLPDGRVLALTVRHMTELRGAGVVTDSALLAIYDRDGAMVDSIGRFAHNQRVVRRIGDRQTTLELPFSTNGAFAVLDRVVCHVFGTRAEIRCYDLSGQLTRIIRMDHAPVPVEARDIDAFWDRELQSRNARRVRALQSMREALVFPDAYPAFSDLVADDRQRLWARMYRRPGQRLSRWAVFEDGRWAASVEVDTAFHVTSIAGDRIIGIWRDELGLESVRVYQLTRQ